MSQEHEREIVKRRLKSLERILRELRDSWVFVEGQKDRRALLALLERAARDPAFGAPNARVGSLGITNVLTISGNLRQSCEKVRGLAARVVVLTDLDRRGDGLAESARLELEACSVAADTETRKRLAAILNLRCFEDAERKYVEFMEKVKELKA